MLTRKEAIAESIRHWEDNLELAKRGELQVKHILASECPLCEMYWKDCKLELSGEKCPLWEAQGGRCGFRSKKRLWDAVSSALVERTKSQEKIINACKKLLAVLKTLK